MILQARGLLFDNDGVLVDSMGTVDGSWGKWSQEFAPGFKISYAHHGKRASEIVRSLVSEDNYEQALERINQLELDLVHLTTAMPGARQLLEALEPGSWTVVTSAGRELGMGRLEAAGLPVPELLVSADEVSKGKPDPEPYLIGARKLGLSAEDCIVFEDAPSGVAAAVAARAKYVLGVGSEVLQSDADFVLTSLEGISFTAGELIVPEENLLR